MELNIFNPIIARTVRLVHKVFFQLKESKWNRTFEYGITPRQESEQHGAAFEQTLERLQAKKSTFV